MQILNTAVTKRFLLIILVLFHLLPASAKVELSALKVNYQETPLGIETETPRFSWQMTTTDTKRGQYQTAYQIIVTDESDSKVWDSGKVQSDITLGIRYEGKPLKATTRYGWQLKIWDKDQQISTKSSWFETGLMNDNPNLSAWGGATWIGGSDDDLVLQSPYLSVFKIDYALQLDKAANSTKAAFILGANDRRLMNKDQNLFGVENGANESYIAFELDIASVNGEESGLAKMNIYRVGYTLDDKANTPFASFDIPLALINANNKNEQHQVYLESVYGVFQIAINGNTAKQVITPTTDTNGRALRNKGVNLNPSGSGGDFICYPMVADIGFAVDKNQAAKFSNVKIRHFREPSNVIYSLVEEKFATTNSPQLKIVNPSRNASPMLRTEFQTDNKTVQKARIYVTARGIYELYLNGQRLGADYFNPGLTQYNKNHFYQTYDVTNLVNKGNKNALGAWLSEGWWSGSHTFRGESWNYFGDRQSLLCKMVITYADGSEKVITSNDRDWKLFTDGPIRYGSFFQGEIYDATKEVAIRDWTKPNFEGKNWKSVVAVPLEGTSLMGSFIDFAGRTIPLQYDQLKISSQIGDNVQIVKTLSAQSVEEVRPGVFVYDMGQNMVGFPNISLQNGTAGKTIALRYAEVKYPNLSEYEGNIGMIMLENIRAALAQDLYTMRGGEEVIQPRFTFHGYRYLEITGIDQALPLAAVKGKVLSSMHQLASNYETSNSLVNKLWQNITWSLRGNFLSIPTDTPARNERMGWSGDINVFSRAATWLADANLFLNRHLLAMRDIQGANGKFTDVAPVGGGFGGTLWGSAGIVVAWETYQQYGDITLLQEHYEAMKRYIEFLDTRLVDGILIEGPLGDWLSPENGKNDNTLLWTAYHIYDLEILQKVATILNKKDDAAFFQQRYEERKSFFNATYMNKNNRKTIKSGIVGSLFGPSKMDSTETGKPMDTQASYAIPLAFDIIKEEYKAEAVNHLATTITRQNTDDGGVIRPEYSLMTGFIGTASISEALSENDRDDLAYRLLQQESYPSWLYPVVNGATTIWERLNSYTIDNGFGGNNSMNSFNHYSFGAVAAWMYNYSLGIQRDPAQPGFKHFLLKPTPDPNEKMTFAKGYYDSMYGKIISEWYLETGGIRYKLSVPPNTSARLYLKADDVKKIRESGKKLKKAKGVRYLSQEKDRLVFELTSGNYVFFVKK